jgi:hypothetical protein
VAAATRTVTLLVSARTCVKQIPLWRAALAHKKPTGAESAAPVVSRLSIFRQPSASCATI